MRMAWRSTTARASSVAPVGAPKRTILTWPDLARSHAMVNPDAEDMSSLPALRSLKVSTTSSSSPCPAATDTVEENVESTAPDGDSGDSESVAASSPASVCCLNPLVTVTGTDCSGAPENASTCCSPEPGLVRVTRGASTGSEMVCWAAAGSSDEEFDPHDATSNDAATTQHTTDMVLRTTIRLPSQVQFQIGIAAILGEDGLRDTTETEL